MGKRHVTVVMLTISAEVGYILNKSVNGAGRLPQIGKHFHLPEINAQNLGGRVLVRHINGPDTSTGSNVKDALWAAPYRCFMQRS
jgi:hypothetical protein